MKTTDTILVLLSTSLLTASSLAVQPPGILNYQGVITADGLPFNGTGLFKFALVDAAGTTAYWSNDGTSTTGDEPTAAVSLSVNNGRYSVALGDTTIANMTAAIPASVFADHADVRLRVWFDDGTNGSQLLSPDQRLVAVGYALNAAIATSADSADSVAAANITGTVGLAQLPTAVLVTNGASGVNISGTFTGDGAGLSGVDLLEVNSHGAISFTTDYENFVLASSPHVGNGPLSVTSADVNGDGHPDLISANENAKTLTVLTNDGNGGFALASSPSVGNGPLSVTSADVNGDGHPDLASANFNANTLTVLTNDGSGGFVVASSPGVGSQPYAVTSADVNGDGHPDLISANRADHTLTVLTNDGSGGFVTAASPVVGNLPLSLTSADVNGDGHPDLISANGGPNTLTVLTNDGSGGFVLASSPGVGSVPYSVTSADINGDGHPDLISANYAAGTLTVLTNNGSGGFVTATTPTVGGGPNSVTAADVNGDGHPDLISTSESVDTLTVLTNDGNGSFVLAFSPGVGYGPASVTAVDLNGDGHPDLVSANYGSSTLTVLFNIPTSYTGVFAGDGSGLTGLNAGNLTGSVPAASLTSVPAASLTGTVPLAQLPSAVVTNNETGVNLDGTFTGDGSGLTGVPGDNLGNHTATQNINLNGHWLSGDGNSEGVFVDGSGHVGIGQTTPSEALDVAGNTQLTANDPEIVFLDDTGSNGNRTSAIRNTLVSALGVDPPSAQNMQFVVNGTTTLTLRGDGNVGIGTTSPSEKLQVIGNILASGTVTGSSDRNVKEDFAPVDPRAVLDKVAALPISTWQYIADNPGVRHVGPMAQDFYGAFQVGMDDKHISMVDADGVALAAIQGLNDKVQGTSQKAEVRIQKLEAENAELKARLEKIETLLNHRLIGGMR